MANSDGGSPQKVNPVLLVVLGIALLAVVINFVISKPKNSTPAAVTAPVATTAPTATPESSTPAATNTEVVNPNGGEEVLIAQDSGGIGLNRNPFLTPSIYLNSNQPNIDETPSHSPNNNELSVKPDDSPVVQPQEDLRLGAVFQKAHDKVALVYYQGKGYILRVNDALKNTIYRLKTISKDSVVLASEDGNEKTLRLIDKPIKKGGGE